MKAAAARRGFTLCLLTLSHSLCPCRGWLTGAWVGVGIHSTTLLGQQKFRTLCWQSRHEGLERASRHRRGGSRRSQLPRDAAQKEGEETTFTVYAHPSDSQAQAAAAKLVEALTSGFSSGSRQERAVKLVLELPTGDLAGCAIYFGPSGTIELLRNGEAAGKGFSSDLPKVLLDQCTPRGQQQDVLLKAIGKKRKGLTILDATAGFAHDALRMAAAGHRVLALERDPVVHTFVRCGLEGIQGKEGELWRDRIVVAGGSLQTLNGEARRVLQACRERGLVMDVVYLDPMFPSAKRKSALPKRRMQWLRAYLDAIHHSDATQAQDGQQAQQAFPQQGHQPHLQAPMPASIEEEVKELVEMAREVACKVVLKRADDGPVVGKPSSQVSSSKIVRYDVYTGVLLEGGASPTGHAHQAFASLASFASFLHPIDHPPP